MTTINPTKCLRCDSTKNLINHHISYLPEVIGVLCRKCDANERRHPISRGFPILKLHPQRGLIIAEQYVLNHFNTELLELDTCPISPVGVVFPYMAPFEDVEKSLQIVLDDIRFRMTIKNREEREECGEQGRE